MAMERFYLEDDKWSIRGDYRFYWIVVPLFKVYAGMIDD